MKFSHVIWDWNGTLVDDAALCVQSLNKLLLVRNYPLVDQEEYRRQFGFPVISFYEKRGFDFAVESYDKVADEFISHYHVERFSCPLREGALELLRYIQGQGVTQSILSAYKHQSLREAVHYYGLSHFFTGMNGLDNNRAGSKVELGKQVLAQLSYEPDTLLYIGDTNHDVEVAHELGIAVVVIEGGHQSRERLEETGELVFSSLYDVISWIEEQ